MFSSIFLDILLSRPFGILYSEIWPSQPDYVNEGTPPAHLAPCNIITNPFVASYEVILVLLDKELRQKSWDP